MSEREWQQTIQCVENGVYRIKMNRPDKLNAFSSTMYHEVKHGVLRGSVMPEVDSILIEGVEGAFATGGDLAEFLDILELPTEEFISEYTARFDEPTPFRTILECPKPVVAKIDGLCLAGGLLVASTCDVAIATPESRFGVPEGRVGLADPFCATLLPLSIGLSRARYLMVTAEFIGAEQAERWGLIHHVVERQALDASVEKALAGLRRISPQSRWSYKQTANRMVGHMSVEAVVKPVMTANGREGLRAFVEKRDPEWDRTLPIR